MAKIAVSILIKDKNVQISTYFYIELGCVLWPNPRRVPILHETRSASQALKMH